ncbi:MAG: alpha/beta hydrolase [Deltaproteobacteria bacterium]|nr:alpha/beta hydrolase [Deltaproteobacteria bacterium]
MSGMRPHIRTQNIGHADLSYLLYDGNGPTIIFLHATGFLPWLWHPVARTLSSFYRIIVPHFSDHSDEDPAKGGINWLSLAEDLSLFCKRLHVENPLLVGHSMGATISTMVTALYGLQSKGMVLIEPIFLPRPFYLAQMSVNDHPLARKAIKRTNTWQNEAEAMEYVKSKTLFKSWNEEVLELYVRYGMIRTDTGTLQLACSPQHEAALFMGGMQYDPWPILPNVICPVLILEGEKSENRHFIDLTEVVSRLPQGSHKIIKDAGHLIPMELPEKTAAIIGDYFQSIVSY